MSNFTFHLAAVAEYNCHKCNYYIQKHYKNNFCNIIKLLNVLSEKKILKGKYDGNNIINYINDIKQSNFNQCQIKIFINSISQNELNNTFFSIPMTYFSFNFSKIVLEINNKGINYYDR